MIRKKAANMMFALIWGFTICLTVVLYLESCLSLAVTALIMVCVVAPFTEELFKLLPIFFFKKGKSGKGYNVVLFAVISALGFALAELFYHNIISYIDKGVWYVTFWPMLHLLFVLPCSIIVARTNKKGFWIIGYLTSVILHVSINYLSIMGVI
jgi:RsiW-degrading membrane proteinase PrsW (M82 family)